MGLLSPSVESEGALRTGISVAAALRFSGSSLLNYLSDRTAELLRWRSGYEVAGSAGHLSSGTA